MSHRSALFASTLAFQGAVAEIGAAVGVSGGGRAVATRTRPFSERTWRLKKVRSINRGTGKTEIFGHFCRVFPQFVYL